MLAIWEEEELYFGFFLQAYARDSGGTTYLGHGTERELHSSRMLTKRRMARAPLRGIIHSGKASFVAGHFSPKTVSSSLSMRISIPSIPNVSSRPNVEYTLAQATDLLTSFLQDGHGKALIMTGAGVSVDSGIAPYRGEGGHYTVHKTYRPIFYPEFVDESSKGHQFRQRYWSRSFLGFKPVQYAEPNPTHFAIAALQRLGYVPEYITQNVDNLHHAATPSQSIAASSILELHGSLQRVVCVQSPKGHVHGASPQDPQLAHRLSSTHLTGPRSANPRPYNTPTGEAYPKGCGFRGSRSRFQDVLEETNPRWHHFAQDMRAKGTEPKTNPDGDVDLGDADYSSFRYPPCPCCGGVLKPAVIFFGESVPEALKERSFDLVDKASRFLLIGTSLATYSAFRLVKSAVEQGKPCLILNKGPTRADEIVPDKVELGSSETLTAVAKKLANGRQEKDPVLRRLLESGVVVSAPRRRGVVSS